MERPCFPVSMLMEAETRGLNTLDKLMSELFRWTELPFEDSTLVEVSTEAVSSLLRSVVGG